MRLVPFLFAALFPFLVYAQTVQIAGDNGRPLGMSNGGVPVDLKGRLFGEDTLLNQLWVSLAGTGCVISTATSTECKEGAGEVVGFYVANTTSGTIRFFDDNDGTCSTGASTAVITPAVGWHFLPLKFATAICVLTTNTIGVTVIYR